MGSDAYSPAPYRWARTPYRRTGRSGLRLPQVTTLLVGASSVHQLEQNLETLTNLDLSADELRAIDELAVDGTGRD